MEGVHTLKQRNEREVTIIKAIFEELSFPVL
jgi:hypothetical protein